MAALFLLSTLSPAAEPVPSAPQGVANSAPLPVTPIEKVLPQIARDGHALSCIHALIKERKIKEWEAAKKAYYPSPGSKLKRLWGYASWAFAGVLGLSVASQLGNAPPERSLIALVTIPIALYLIDWASAFSHKILDSIASERNPLLGEAVRDSRIHHENQMAITGGNYFDRISEPSPIMAPALAATALASSQGVIGPEVGLGMWFFWVFGMHMTYFHQQAHTKKPNWPIRMLQKIGLIFSVKDHRQHHELPYDGYFSLVNGWSDGHAKRLGLWTKIDKIYWKYFKRMPGNWIQDPTSIPAEVQAELQADLDSIPEELWTYSLTAFPDRVPDELKDPLEIVQARWRVNFIRERQKEYASVAGDYPDLAAEGWLQEQKDFPWIYGTQPISLNAIIPE